MTIQSLSKRAASKYKPERPTLLISIQDGDKGNPLWARNASIKQIANMKLYESEARHEGNFELFLEYFDRLLAVSHDYMRGVNIMRTSGIGMPF